MRVGSGLGLPAEGGLHCGCGGTQRCGKEEKPEGSPENQCILHSGLKNANELLRNTDNILSLISTFIRVSSS